MKRILPLCLILLFIFSAPVFGDPESEDGQTEAAVVSAPVSDGEQQFPDWFTGMDNMPAWAMTLDEFPDWFYDLPSEPVWFRQITSIPAWFYTITEIPAWFYPEAAPVQTPAPVELPVYAPTPYTTPYPQGNTGRQDYISGPPPAEISPDDASGDETEPDNMNEDISDFSEDEINGELTPFEYKLPDGVLYTSIPNGLITSESVWFKGDVETLLITRDGELYEHGNDFIYGHGEYTVNAINYPELELFSFRIIANPVNVFEYTVPDGFSLRDVSYNGENLVITDRSVYTPEQDGAYTFTVASLTNANHIFYTTITLKTRPPVVYFEGLSENMASDGPVNYWTDETDIFITVTLKGKEIQANGVLHEPGQYVVTAEDSAGNVSEYSFRIFYSMNVSGIWVIIITVFLLALVIGYAIYCRKRFRVR